MTNILIKSINKELPQVKPVTVVKELESRFPITVILPTGQKSKYLYVFTLYRTSVLYPLNDIFYSGTSHSGSAEVEAYGLSYRKLWYEDVERQESKDIDLGLLSAQMWQVSAILTDLVNLRIVVDLQNPSGTPMIPEQVVERLLSEAIARISKQSGRWGNPFAKAAEREFIKGLKSEGITSRLVGIFSSDQQNLGGLVPNGN